MFQEEEKSDMSLKNLFLRALLEWFLFFSFVALDEAFFNFAGVTLWHILKTESTVSWHHSAALHLLPLGGACFSKDFNFLIQWYNFWFLGCEFNKTTMVGSWGIVPRMLVFFGFEI
ncbi:hypothetical protein CK203_014024 [Vitis vinifera]|uniref:Uncharacterized protein n=1 Tax=Vitis vinifera TaxID=29760 RepID=A0A438JI55_VITVI|nr:hypothetical protein CK203_014024 [Vitis vinifera]